MPTPIIPVQWKTTGHSKNGTYFKVRGVILGHKHEIANCPYIVGSESDKAEAEANAEFIVRACNSHADLVAALKMVDEDIKSFRQIPHGGVTAIAVERVLAKATGI